MCCTQYHRDIVLQSTSHVIMHRRAKYVNIVIDPVRNKNIIKDIVSVHGISSMLVPCKTSSNKYFIHAVPTKCVDVFMYDHEISTITPKFKTLPQTIKCDIVLIVQQLSNVVKVYLKQVKICNNENILDTCMLTSGDILEETVLIE